jgi:hypothetical protein
MLETVVAVETMALLFVAVAIVIISCASENRRKLAAWLLSSAQAEDEIRRAKMGIEVERRIRQQDLEARFLSKPRQEERGSMAIPG